MRSHLKLVFAASLLCLAACQPTETAAAPPDTAVTPAAPPELKLTCVGPLSPATTGDDLVKTVGAENVADETLPGMDGETLKITAIYPKDAKRRVEITFADAEKREGLVRAEIKNLESAWYGPEDIQM